VSEASQYQQVPIGICPELAERDRLPEKSAGIEQVLRMRALVFA